MKKNTVTLIAILIAAFISCSKSNVKELASPREQYNKAMEYYNNGKNFKAQMNFQKVIYSFPGQTFIDTAQFYLSMSFYNMKNYSEAIGEFRKLLAAYPVSAFADDATYFIGASYYQQSPGFEHDPDYTYSAIDEFSLFLTRYPNSEYVADARKKLADLNYKLAKKMYKNGELYLKIGSYEPALIYFQQVRDNYPSTEWAKSAFYYSGVAEMKLKKYSEAIETFQNFIITFPDHKLASKARKKISELQKNEQGG